MKNHGSPRIQDRRLFGLYVETSAGKVQKIFPSMNLQAISELAQAVTMQILRGKEKRFSNPTILEVTRGNHAAN